MKNWRYIAYGAIGILAVLFPLYSGLYIRQVAISILIYLALALSWDMLLRSGQISFGTAGFFGLGSYAAVLLHLSGAVSPIVAILLGGLFAFIIAIVFGVAVLRLRGMYFAITTLALASIFMLMVRNVPALTGGPAGKMLPSVIFGGDPSKMYWLALAVALITIAVSEVFQRTRIFFALTSIRDNELVAKSSGIDVFKYLVFAFAVTSALQGMIGGVYGEIYGFVSPEGSFNVNFLLLPLAMALLGGIHSTAGPIVGAVVLGVLGEYLKLKIPYGHHLVYGAIIIIVTLFMTKGIMGVVKRRRLGTKKSEVEG
jgi:branched-chain amino acid transport system permease protein